MHSAKLTAPVKKIAFFIFVVFTYTFASAQENSPYSRYGLGDVVPAQNMVSRGMGGITAGFIDSSGFLPYSQSINLNNPASLGSLNTTLFDIGAEIDIRNLKSNSTLEKYTAVNTIISYLQLGFPITPKRMAAKGNYWGISFGLRPETRVGYKIIENKRLPGLDSISTLYEGSGGLNRANFSTGIKFKRLSIGLSTGYSFGNRETSTKLSFLDSTGRPTRLYMQSNTQAQARFGGVFLNLGAQYAIRLQNKSVLRLGVTANLGQNLRAKRDNVNETFLYSPQDGSVISIDTVNFSKDQAGTIKLPASFSGGFTYTNAHWLFGADVEYTSWSQYRYFNAKDAVQDNVTFRMGAQYYPARVNTPSNKYWSFVKYRAGFYYGNDYIKLNTNRPAYGFTFGAGLPLTSFRRLRLGEFVTLNAGAEAGQHGNKNNLGIRETILRFNFGIAMTAAWFQKRKYD